MNVCGVTFGGYLAKILSFKLGNLLYKSNFYLLSEGTVLWEVVVFCYLSVAVISNHPNVGVPHGEGLLRAATQCGASFSSFYYFEPKKNQCMVLIQLIGVGS